MDISENDTVLDESRNPIGTKFTKRVLREVFLLEGGVVAIILGICVIGYTFGTLMIHCVRRLMTGSDLHVSKKGPKKSTSKKYPDTPNPSLLDPRDGLDNEELLKSHPVATNV